MLDVLNKELPSIAIVLEVGQENFVMSSKSHVNVPHKTEVYLAPSFARTVGIARIVEIVMSVFVDPDSKEATARKTLMNVPLIHAKMVRFVRTSLVHIDVNALQGFKDQTVNST